MKRNQVINIEFGICVNTSEGEQYFTIPVDSGVQNTLWEMFETTYSAVNPNDDTVQEYDPSEKYSNTEKIKISLDNENLEKLKNFYSLENLESNHNVLSEKFNDIEFYFAIITTNDLKKIIAVKRPAQFKGLLKKKNSLIQLIDNTLQLVGDTIFKLDSDFDFYITDTTVYILHPQGFVFISDIDKYVLTKAEEATKNLSKDIKFIHFEPIAKYVSKHPRAAKLVASIRSRNDLNEISEKLLKDRCKECKIPLKTKGKLFFPEEGYEMDFLEVLDRRIYSYELIKGKTELYEAHSRAEKKQE